MTNHKKRKRSDLHNNTSLNIFCYKNEEEDINDIENEFNKVLLEKAQQNAFEEDNQIKQNLLHNILLDKNEFEKKYNIKYNLEFN